MDEKNRQLKPVLSNKSLKNDQSSEALWQLKEREHSPKEGTKGWKIKPVLLEQKLDGVTLINSHQPTQRQLSALRPKELDTIGKP